MWGEHFWSPSYFAASAGGSSTTRRRSNCSRWSAHSSAAYWSAAALNEWARELAVIPTSSPPAALTGRPGDRFRSQHYLPAASRRGRAAVPRLRSRIRRSLSARAQRRAAA
ncbi:hypothetical protein ABZ504_49285 [Streptomyces mirabilis]|uniref:hypothetical protein n=1 Tax=Streptomyces mirabilis TaxID=68239 RepID=UPI00341190A8